MCFDYEGYSLTDGKHKRFGVTRQELRDAEVRACEEDQAIRERQCAGHVWRMLSHEERICRHCGRVEFMADL